MNRNMFEDGKATVADGSSIDQFNVTESALVWEFLLPCCYPTSAPTTRHAVPVLIEIYEAAHKYEVYRAMDAVGKILMAQCAPSDISPRSLLPDPLRSSKLMRYESIKQPQ
jgi:hypothetical protein